MSPSGVKLDGASKRHVRPSDATDHPRHPASQPPAGRPPSLRKLSLQTGIVYGPVESRRLGLSLGINLLPTSYKLCSFNCVYCQYGWTKKGALASTQGLADLPSLDAIATAIEAALVQLSSAGKTVESITICGNGEPTLYPDLGAVIEIAKQARDQYQPQARLAILSNSSTVGNKTVRDALEMLDIKVMKFDAGSEEIFQQLNHPRAPIYMGDIVTGLKELKNIILQSLFVQGRVTNADPDSVGLWVEKVREIRPLGVQVYTLEREPADERIGNVSLATLQWIAEEVRWRAGVPVDVF
ncbi:MAG: radical SAM protein [Deltaproteobacteria bacterium]|nr:radical SAM protein [Deltaproteobacteria bacterium]